METGPQLGKSGRKWRIRKSDRDGFLRPVKFSTADLDRVRTHESDSVGHRCLTTLRGVSESLKGSNVLISDRVSIDEAIWALQIYKDSPSSFPITNVPIKCNVMATMVDSLREYVAQGAPESSVSGLTKTMDYLRKLLGAVIFKAEGPENSALGPSSPNPHPPNRPTSGAMPSRGNTRRISATAVSGGVPKGKKLSTDNLQTFHEYKPLIVSLHHRLTFLDQTSRQNDFIFEFISQNICKFILDDCKLLLVDYIEKRILQI